MSTSRFALITTAALGLSSALNFLALFLWVRLLDPHDFGIYSLASASALLLNALLFEWLRIVSARTLYDTAEPSKIHLARADALFAISLGIAALLGLVGAALWLGGAHPAGIAPAWIPLVVLFALSEMALAMVNVVSRVRMEAWQFFQSMVVRSALAIALGVVLVLYFDLGALGIVVGTVAAQLVTAAAIIARSPVWRGLRIGRRSRASRETLRGVLVLGAPLIVSTALAYGAGVADRYIVAAVLDTAAVGYYAAASDLLQKTLGFVLLAINISAYPALVRAYEDHGASAARRLLEDNFVMQVALGLPMVAACVAFAPGIASLLLGPTFRTQGELLLPWIAAGALIRLLTTYHLLMIFQLTQQMKLMLVAPLVTLVVLVPAGIEASRGYGTVGMAAVSLGAQLAAYAVCAVIAKRLFAFAFLTGDLVKVVFASAVLGLCLWPARSIHDPLAAAAVCAAGGLGYVLLLLALRLDRARPVVGWAMARLRRA